MWQVIQNIGSPLALAAFVVAVLATIYRARIQSDIEKLRSLPESERTSLLQQTIETYHIADDNLTRQQKFELMTLVLTGRANRLKMVLHASVALVAIIAVAAVVALIFRPDTGKSSREDATWKRNYAFFASREWPDEPNFGMTGQPETWIKVVWRPDLEEALQAVVLSGEPELEVKRDSLLLLVRNASIMNELNPRSIRIDERLDKSYRDFKRLLRAAAASRGVDVEQLEREKYVPPE